jgi:sulfur-oxidizing protein SoxY
MNGLDLKHDLTRRTALLSGAAALSVLVIRPARATTETMQAAIREFSGGSPIKPGKVTLDIPPLVENGNSVPLIITVDSPMTATDHVKTIAVFNERNPQSNIANFHLNARSGRAYVSTRIRLGDSQTIMAIAQLSDGTFWSGSAELVVTLPACAEN